MLKTKENLRQTWFLNFQRLPLRRFWRGVPFIKDKLHQNRVFTGGLF